MACNQQTESQEYGLVLALMVIRQNSLNTNWLTVFPDF